MTKSRRERVKMPTNVVTQIKVTKNWQTFKRKVTIRSRNTTANEVKPPIQTFAMVSCFVLPNFQGIGRSYTGQLGVKVKKENVRAQRHF